jgi:sialidase-1
MNNQVWARTSDDDGKTWSAARDLTRSARDFENWGAVFTGPGGAIQTRTGRLLVPAAMKFDAYSVQAQAGGFTGPMNAMRAYAFYSDDKGETWKRGGLVQAFTNENQLVELADGAILMDARQGMGDYRWQMISQDGGASWSRPQLGNKVTTIAAGIERVAPDLLLWSGLGGPGRRHLVVRVSRDEGQTWTGERTVYGGPAAYSDLTVTGDGMVGIIWERGVSDGYQFVTLTRVNREWLEEEARSEKREARSGSPGIR